MKTCEKCGAFFTGEYCVDCNVGSEEYARDYANVTWGEVRNHLFKRLSIDAESVSEGDREYFWWPGFLCQHVYVEGEGRFDDSNPDNWLQIVAETVIGSMEETLGIALADQANNEFPFGAAFYSNGILRLRTAFAFNPLNRPLLNIFHEQVLAQATLAHELAIRWDSADGVQIALSSNPTAGEREHLDELLGVFWGDTYGGGAIVEGFSGALLEARTIIPEIMLSNGWQPGFSNHEVNFFLKDNASIGIGIRPADPENLKYGPGIFIYANDMNFRQSFEPEEANFMNLLASELSRASHFGSFVSKSYLGEMGSRMTAYIPYGPLAESRFNPANMAINITNFAIHVSQSCLGAFWLLNNRVYESTPETQDDSNG